MNSGPLLFLGFLLSLALSFWGMILVPHRQIGQAQQTKTFYPEDLYPRVRPGLAQRGAQVYVANGCAECHTQQVQPKETSADEKRMWGERRSVARDFLYDYPVQLGKLRLGPDLSNVGQRQTNATWHLIHLYDPRAVATGSTMPRYPYLFEAKAIKNGVTSPDALVLGDKAPVGKEIVPKQEAKDLVAYLLSLQNQVSVLEAQLPPPPTNRPPAGATNQAPAGVTNGVEASSSSAPTNAPPQ